MPLMNGLEKQKETLLAFVDEIGEGATARNHLNISLWLRLSFLPQCNKK
jgi:hypothetical protein